MTAPLKIGIIGGTGVSFEGLKGCENLSVELEAGKEGEAGAGTKLLWGEPSMMPQSLWVLGANGEKVAQVFLMRRHGADHTIPPSAVDYRANIGMLRELGVTHILAFSAVGSLSPKMKIREFAVVDQYLDYTQGRVDTFFDEPGVVAHCNCYEPTDREFSKVILDIAQSIPGLVTHPTATSVTINGPHFAPKAELRRYINAGGELIGMTTCTEAKLAKETAMRYANVALITDEGWNEAGAAEVSHQAVEAIMKDNGAFALQIVANFLSSLPQALAACPGLATENNHGIAVLTPERFAQLPEKTKAKYDVVLGPHQPYNQTKN